MPNRALPNRALPILAKSMDTMTIGAFARAGGVGVETVRYYQRRGLMPVPAPRVGGATHRYGAEDLRRLRFIRAAQGAGFTLAEVAGLLASSDADNRARIRALATTRIVALDANIAALQEARDALRRLTATCSATEAGPCPIVAAFEAG